jgi:AraC-like DNA-binding protein
MAAAHEGEEAEYERPILRKLMQSSLWMPNSETNTEALHRTAVARVLEAIQNRSEQPLTLEEMARIALISRHHFIRIFHRLMGIPPIRYQWAMRLAYAKRLLVETNMSVIDVCFEAGYNSLGSFTRRFTELVGIPPHHFRMTARSFDHSRLSRLMSAEPDSADAEEPGQIEGEVQAPAGFSGLIFVGLFPAERTHGMPVACCALGAPGRFRIAGLPDGHYHLNAAAIPFRGGMADYFLNDNALRASVAGGPLVVCGGGVISGGCSLTLRRPELMDLPILVALVPLLEGKLARGELRMQSTIPEAAACAFNVFPGTDTENSRVRVGYGD